MSEKNISNFSIDKQSRPVSPSGNINLQTKSRWIDTREPDPSVDLGNHDATVTKSAKNARQSSENLPLSSTENFWKYGEQKGKPLSYAIRSRIMQALSEKKWNEKQQKWVPKWTQDEIANQMKVHKRTIGNYKKSRKDQGLDQVPKMDGDQLVHYPIGVPEPGKQGGFRWSRMNDAQQDTCVRLAIENPRDTIADLKQKLLSLYPNLRISDSTVWRTLKIAGVSYMRAKLRDPLGGGDLATNAKNAEMKSFVEEQKKGKDGALNPMNAFFMDETIVTMNLVASKGWGTKDAAPSFAQAKGKTMTLNLYAGLGLIDENMVEDTKTTQINGQLADTDFRGNHYKKDFDKQWYSKSNDKPKRFALFWWIRPPTRESTVLDPFLNTNDILDPNFKLCLPQIVQNANNLTDQDLKKYFFSPIEDDEEVTTFLKPLDYDVKTDLEKMQQLLWFNNVEHRQVDAEDATLIKDEHGNFIIISLENMVKLFENLQVLVNNVVNKIDIGSVNNAIPRQYYTNNGKIKKGGKVNSERGDRSLFIQYLIGTTNYVKNVFGEKIRNELGIIMDSAPQHGKVDIDSNHISYIHRWVENNLLIKRAVFLPVKAPDFNPVEMLFAYLKSQIRLKQRSYTGEMTVQEMIQLVDDILLQVTEEMVQGWVRYSCYRIPGDNTPLDQARCVDYLDKSGEKYVPDEKMSASEIAVFAIEQWKKKFIKSTGVKTCDILNDGDFNAEFLSSINNYDGSRDVLEEIFRPMKLFDKKKDLKKHGFLPDEEEEEELQVIPQKSFPCKLFQTKTDILNIESIKYDRIHNIIGLIHKFYDYELRYKIEHEDNSSGSPVLTLYKHDNDNSIRIRDYDVDDDDNDDLSENIIIEISHWKISIKNKCRFVLNYNLKRKEYRELYDMLLCVNDIGFLCLEDHIVNEARHQNISDLPAFCDTVKYLKNNMKGNEGILYSLNKSFSFVKRVLNEMYGYSFVFDYDEKDMLSVKLKKLNNILEKVLDGFFSVINKGDQIEIIKQDKKYKIVNGDMSMIVTDFDQIEFAGYTNVIKSRSSYFEINDKQKKFENKFFYQLLNFDDIGVFTKEVLEILRQTPYKSCIPDTENETQPLNICIIIVKAMIHELNIIVEVNEFILKGLSTTLHDKIINWSLVKNVVYEAHKMLMRKCDTCKRSKFKRFPYFSVNNLREQHLQINKMKKKAMKRYANEDARRYPGYPDLTDEERATFKERGSGPNFETTYDENGDLVSENKIDKITRIEYNNNKMEVTVKVGGVEKVIREIDVKTWDLFFGNFAQENQMLLNIMKQRKEESDAKNTKKLNDNWKKQFLRQITSPNGTICTYEETTGINHKKTCIFDSEKRRIYPPLECTYNELRSSTENFTIAFVKMEKNQKKFNMGFEQFFESKEEILTKIKPHQKIFFKNTGSSIKQIGDHTVKHTRTNPYYFMKTTTDNYEIYGTTDDGRSKVVIQKKVLKAILNTNDIKLLSNGKILIHKNKKIEVSFKKTLMRVSKSDDIKLYVENDKELQQKYHDLNFGSIVCNKQDNTYSKVVNIGYELGFTYDMFKPFTMSMLDLDTLEVKNSTKDNSLYIVNDSALKEFLQSETGLKELEKEKLKKLMYNLQYLYPDGSNVHTLLNAKSERKKQFDVIFYDESN